MTSIPNTDTHRSVAPASARRAPRLLIGLPVYNGQRFLSAALDSLLAQTFQAFEILISDNASTDATPAIASEYMRRDSRIHYVRQPINVGAPQNWNFVAQASRYEYFKWASANDTLGDRMLERCVSLLDGDPGAVLAQGRTCLVNEETGQMEEYAFDLALDEPRPRDRLYSLLTRMRLNNGQSGVIRASALRKTRLDRPYASGDLVLMAELALQGRFVVLPEVLLFRRMGPSSFSASFSAEQERRFLVGDAQRGPWSVPWRLQADLLRSVATAPLSLAERAACLKHVLRSALWEARSKSKRSALRAAGR